MNQYLGDLLSFRSGIRESKLYPEYLATVYSEMDIETGRSTTPLIDLTAGAPYYYLARGQYHAIRRDANDFYTEGELVWLDVDTIIRERSHGARSLDTFLHKFTEPSSTGPMVVTYTRSQVEELLNTRRTLRLARILREVRLLAHDAPADRRTRALRLEVRLHRQNEQVPRSRRQGRQRVVLDRGLTQFEGRGQGRARRIGRMEGRVGGRDDDPRRERPSLHFGDLQRRAQESRALDRTDRSHYASNRLVPNAQSSTTTTARSIRTWNASKANPTCSFRSPHQRHRSNRRG